MLADGEPYDSPRAKAQAGPSAVMVMHDLAEAEERRTLGYRFPEDLQPLLPMLGIGGAHLGIAQLCQRLPPLHVILGLADDGRKVVVIGGQGYPLRPCRRL